MMVATSVPHTKIMFVLSKFDEPSTNVERDMFVGLRKMYLYMYIVFAFNLALYK